MRSERKAMAAYREVGKVTEMLLSVRCSPLSPPSETACRMRLMAHSMLCSQGNRKRIKMN